MLTFKEHIVLPKKGLGIARDQMPQVKKPNLDKFIEFAKKDGITFDDCEVPANKLKSTQDDFDVSKIESMMGKEFDSVIPLLVSQDFYLADGHHRWLADLNKNPEQLILIRQSSCPILELLACMRRFEASIA